MARGAISVNGVVNATTGIRAYPNMTVVRAVLLARRAKGVPNVAIITSQMTKGQLPRVVPIGTYKDRTATQRVKAHPDTAGKGPEKTKRPKAVTRHRRSRRRTEGSAKRKAANPKGTADRATAIDDTSARPQSLPPGVTRGPIGTTGPSQAKVVHAKIRAQSAPISGGRVKELYSNK